MGCLEARIKQKKMVDVLQDVHKMRNEDMIDWK